MSSFNPSSASSGLGGPAAATLFLPTRPAAAAATSSTSATIRAASQASTAVARARIAVVTRVARAKKASSPATLNMPMPRPALLPFSAISAWASRISERMSSGTWVVSWLTRAPSVGSAVSRSVMRSKVPDLRDDHECPSPRRVRVLARRLRDVAGRIREDDIAEVREKARIDDVVSGYVTLRKAGGGSLKGLCPFHDEKSPSFHVTPSRGFFHCFGCQEGGDVIAFLMKIDGLTFGETVERLADKYGVQLRREDGDGPPERPRGPARGRLIEANKIAQEFYAGQLETVDAVAARGFLDRARLRPGRGRDLRAGLRTSRRRGADQAPARSRASATRSRSPPAWWRWGVRRTTDSADACCGRSATPAATPSASEPGGSSTTTRSRRSTSTPPRQRSTRRARCSTASTWPAATWRARRRPWSSRATPT